MSWTSTKPAKRTLYKIKENNFLAGNAILSHSLHLHGGSVSRIRNEQEAGGKKTAICFSETSLNVYGNRQHYIPEDNILHRQRCDSLRWNSTELISWQFNDARHITVATTERFARCWLSSLFSAYSRRNCGKPWHTTIRIAGLWAEIWTTDRQNLKQGPVLLDLR
jgi:hypothetical protein